MSRGFLQTLSPFGTVGGVMVPWGGLTNGFVGFFLIVVVFFTLLVS